MIKKPRLPRKINWILLGILSLAVVAVGGYFWATSLIDSAEAYRSPLTYDPPATGSNLEGRLTNQLVIILIDALRLDTSMNSEAMPSLNSLRQSGASAVMHSQPPSFSAPGWSTLLTGAWPEINDSQLFNPPDPTSVRAFTQDDIFAAADRGGFKTAVSGYFWFEQMLANSGLDAGFFTTGEDQSADKQVLTAALSWLQEDYQLILIHLDQLDYAGHHEGGVISDNWMQAAKRIDGMVGEISGKMDLSTSTLLVLSDHGQIDRGGHGGPEKVVLTEPFVIVGKSIIPGVYEDIFMVDIAPTIAALLGTSIPSSSQGRILTELLSVSEDQFERYSTLTKTQQTSLVSAYAQAIGQSTITANPVTAAPLETFKLVRNTRLAKERVWRNVLAAFIIILPGYLLFIRKEKKAWLLLVASLLYVALFNSRYAFLDHLTYSLSSVKSASWLILYCGTTALGSLLISWLVVMIPAKAFVLGSRSAARITLGFIWMTIYILSIPVMVSFALNGFLVTWFQPEYYSLFLGLISLIQILFVSMGGLLLTGLSAFIARVIWVIKSSQSMKEI